MKLDIERIASGIFLIIGIMALALLVHDLKYTSRLAIIEVSITWGFMLGGYLMFSNLDKKYKEDKK